MSGSSLAGLVAATLLVPALCGTAQAQLYWDTNNSTVGFGTAGGTLAAPTTNNATQGWTSSSTGSTALSGTTTTDTTTANGTLNFGTSANQLGTGTITVSGSVDANSLTFAGSSSNTTLSGGNITLGGTNPAITVTNTANSSATTQTISSNITLGANQTWTINSGGSVGTATLNATNTISSGGSSFGITKTGNGTLILSGSNTYTGATTVNAGLLTLSNASAVAGTSGITVADGARLQTDVGSALQGKAVTITGNGTGTGAVIFNDSGLSSTSATFTLAGNAAIRNQRWSNLTLANAIGESLAGSVLTLTGNSKPDSAFSGSAIYLNGNNTFSGGLVINSLKVRPGNNGWAGANNGLAGVTLQNGGGIDLTSADRTIAGNLTMTDGFIYSSGVARTFAAANFILINGTVSTNATLTGSGSLIKSGAGTVTLTGNNTHSGDTLVSGGTLVLSSSLALQNSALDTSGAGGISLSGVTTPTFGGLKGSGNLASVITGNYSLVTGITLNVGSVANNTYSGVISYGAAGMTLTKNGTGTQVLSGNNTYTGATTINAGTLQLAKTASLYNGTPASWTASNIIVNTGATLALNVGGSGEFTSANVDTIDSLGGASNGFINNSTLALDTTNAGDAFTHSGNISNTNGGSNVLNFAKIGTGTLTLSGNNAYTGVTTISAGTLEIASAGRLGGGSYSANITNNGTFIYSGANSQTLSGVISGTGALTQNNSASTLSLSGANTYTGATTINAGTLSIAAITNGGVAGALGNSTTAASNLVLGGGTLEYRGSANGSTNRDFTLTSGTTSGISVTNSTVSLTISGNAAATTGNLTKLGAGTLILSGNNTYTGATTISAGTLSIAAITNGGVAGGLGNSTIAAGNLVLGGGTLEYTGSANGSTDRNFTLTAGTTSGISVSNSTVALTISGNAAATTGTLTKSGAGTLILSGSNSYTGATAVNAGQLTLSNASAVAGTSGITVENGARIQTDVGSALNGKAVTITGNGTGTGAVINNDGAGTVTMSATFTLAGNAAIRNQRWSNLTLANAIGESSAGSVLTLTGNSKPDSAFSGSTIYLNGNNTFSGGLVINSLRVRPGNNGWAGANNGLAGVTLQNGGGIDLTSADRTIAGNLTMTDGFIYSSGVARTFAAANFILINGTVGSNATLTGNGALTKNGAGTVTLTGANTYNGATTISAGTLSVNGTVANTARIDVNGGSLLIGNTNAIASATTNVTMSGGNLTFAAGLTSNQTFGALTMSSNSTLDLGSGASTLHIAASNGISWTGTLAIWNWTSGTDHIFFGTDNTALTSDQLKQVSFYSGGGSGFLGNAGFGSLGEIIAVPEPGTILAGVLLLGGVAWAERRRLKKCLLRKIIWFGWTAGPSNLLDCSLISCSEKVGHPGGAPLPTDHAGGAETQFFSTPQPFLPSTLHNISS